MSVQQIILKGILSHRHQAKKSKYPKTRKLTSPGEHVQFFCFGSVIKFLSWWMCGYPKFFSC